MLRETRSDSHTLDKQVSAIPQMAPSSPLVRIQRYARVSAQRGIDASVGTALTNYQKFLVLSSCTVLISTGTPLNEAYAVVRICMGNDVTDEQCRRMLRGCQFMHKLVDNLYVGGWGVRAFELLLVCKRWSHFHGMAMTVDSRLGNRSPAYYGTIVHAFEAGLEFLSTELCTKSLVSDAETHSTNWTSIFAPSIISQIVGLEYVTRTLCVLPCLTVAVRAKSHRSWVIITPIFSALVSFLGNMRKEYTESIVHRLSSVSNVLQVYSSRGV